MRLFFLLLFLLQTVFAPAQSTDSLAHHFIDRKLLKADQLRLYKETQRWMRAQIDSMERTMKDGKKGSQQDVPTMMDWLEVKPEDDGLAALSKFLMVASRQAVMVYPGWHIRLGDDASAEQVSADSLQSFSTALLQAGMISRSEWKAVRDALQKKEIGDSLSVAMKANQEKEKTILFQRSEFTSWLGQLANAGFLTTAKADSLSNLAGQGALRSLYSVLLESPQAVVIDLNDYPEAPDQYMKAIHEKVASVLPSLRFDSFRYRIEINKRESFEDYTAYQAVVDLWQKGKKYSMASFYSPPDDSIGMMKNFGKLGDDFYQVFNKILRDQQSSYRLFSAGFSEGNTANYNAIAILALTREQAAAVKKDYFIRLSNEDFDLALPSAAINRAIDQYRQMGLFSHLTPLQVDSAIAVVQQSDIKYYGDILAYFPDVIFEIDLEYGVNRGQYKELTKQLAMVSRGHFTPLAIVDGYDYKKRSQPFVYGFTLNGKIYRTRLRQDDDWLDPGFWELIDKAVKEQDKKGRFHTVYPNDGMRFIYLTHEQFHIVKAKGLLELEEGNTSQPLHEG